MASKKAKTKKSTPKSTQELLEDLQSQPLDARSSSQLSVDIGPTRPQSQADFSGSLEREPPPADSDEDANEHGAPGTKRGRQDADYGDAIRPALPTRGRRQDAKSQPSQATTLSATPNPPSKGPATSAPQPTVRRVGFVSPHVTAEHSATPLGSATTQSTLPSQTPAPKQVDIPPSALGCYFELAEKGVEEEHRAFAAVVLSLSRDIVGQMATASS